MNIPFTPIETLYHGMAGLWNTLRTPQLNQELALRQQAIATLYSPVDPNKSRIDLLKPVYESLTTLLKNHPRLLLYLPSTLIPHSSDVQDERLDLSSSERRRDEPIIGEYAAALIRTFHELARSREPRANITNGDEPDKSELISPAAIIARNLVQKELLRPDWAEGYDRDTRRMSTDTLQTTLPTEDPTNPKRDAWLKWEYQRLTTKTQLDLGEYDAKEWTPPNLEGPLSPNLKTATDEIQRLQTLVTTDPDLKNLIYPIIVIYGSRLKGYGSPTSDLDTAVFIRPINYGNSLHQTENIIRNKIPGTTVYWLIHEDDLKIYDFELETDWLIHEDDLKIYDFELETDTTTQRGAPYDAHVLFNGVWIGDQKTQQFLCERLLKPITQSNRATKDVLRRELERDLLQYRLLHRGYETHYQTTGPTFLDDGYRFLATKLYLKYIFLP